jgi:hypothetical protein
MTVEQRFAAKTEGEDGRGSMVGAAHVESGRYHGDDNHHSSTGRTRVVDLLQGRAAARCGRVEAAPSPAAAWLLWSYYAGGSR